MREFAVSDMPLRGAVGVGDYCYDEESKVFLSNIFKSLSYEESQQEWAGCVLLPETSAIILQELIGFPEYQEAYNSNLFLKMDVPSKNNMGARWCLNWMHLFSNREIASTMEYISGNATKFQGTRQYLSYLEQLPPNPHLDVKAAEGQNGVAQIKLLVSRASLRIKVADAEGNGIEGVNIDFRVIAQS